MLIDEDAELIIAGSGTMANQGSLDIIGLTGDGSLTSSQAPASTTSA